MQSDYNMARNLKNPKESKKMEKKIEPDMNKIWGTMAEALAEEQRVQALDEDMEALKEMEEDRRAFLESGEDEEALSQ